jgi:NAD(P)-dependent dehydrogenase (short-subunit alcohol dehydrogenase family)
MGQHATGGVTGTIGRSDSRSREEQPVSKVWLVTGSSRGLGRALVEAAASAGHRVVATARRPSDVADLVERHQGRVVAAALDVTDPAVARHAIAGAVERFGRLDVVVNNAGYANVSPVETTADDDFRAQFETNFWGVYNVSKAAIPVLRAQGTGLIVQLSSVGGRVGGSPGLASYQAAKFAIDGFSRVLRAELAPFGVRVMVVEPSGFRTDWAGASMTIHAVPAGYEPTVGRMTAIRDRVPPGDPERAASIVVAVVARDDVPERLPLGVNAVEMALALDRQLLAEDERWRLVARSADGDQPYPVPLPPGTGGVAP